MNEYKYYFNFRKPKSVLVIDILKWLITSGIICVAATSPYFISNLLKAYKKGKKYKKKKIYDVFYKLKQEGCIKIEEKNHQIYISLTEKGKKKAGWLQIDSLFLKKPKKWDKKWRIVIFDISHLKKIYREALRGKLKDLNFYQLQKSVWITPFDCYHEITVLKDFFGFIEKEIRLITAQDIGNSEQLIKFFKLN